MSHNSTGGGRSPIGLIVAIIIIGLLGMTALKACQGG